MPKITVAPHKVLHSGKPRWRVCVPKALQTQHNASRRFFKTKVDAEHFADLVNKSRQGWTAQMLTYPETFHGRLLRCLEIAGGNIEALEQAAVIVAGRTAVEKKPLREAINECVQAKRDAGNSQVYCDGLQGALNRFLAGREQLSVSEITPKDVADYLHGNGWKNTTKRSTLFRLKAFFSWATDQKLCNENPCKVVATPKPENNPTCIFTLDDISKLLRECYKSDPKLLSYLALGVFSGIRPAELARLSIEDLKSDCIVVERAKAKTRMRRTVDISPVLREWLKVESHLGWGDVTKRIAAVRERAGVKWGHDIMRHSFVSYSLPIHGSTKVSNWSGHSERVLFAHYAAIVTPEQAKAFAQLTPANVLKIANVVPIQTAA